MESASVALDHVTKGYTLGDGSRLLAADDVCVTLEAGRRTALVGASGSGKSTLLHLIGAIDSPDSGTITVGDQVVTSLSGRRLADFRASVGFVFQQFHLLPALSLLDNVCAPLVGRRVADKRNRGLEVLDAVGLADRAHALPSQLSGGQQQRVAIARALVVRPTVLLADEPTGNLDSATASDILTLLGKLHAQLGTTIVVATHDPDVAGTCDDVIRIADGRATKIDPETLRSPAPRRAEE